MNQGRPVTPVTVGERLLGLAGPRDALWIDGDSLSAARLAGQARGLAGELLAQGLKAGDRVALFASTRPETVAGLLALLSLGVTVVPLDPGAPIAGHRHRLQDSGARLLLLPGEQASARATQAASACAARSALRALAAKCGIATRSLCYAPATDSELVLVAATAPALLLYTSGTTGMPKGVPVSWQGLLWNLQRLGEAWSWEAEVPVLAALPLFHVHGLLLALLGGLRHGGARLLTRFSPAALAAALQARPSLLFGVPTHYHRLVRAAEQDAGLAAALRRARLCVSGSAGLPAKTQRRFLECCGLPIFERYGLTETLINCAVRVCEGPDPGYVGRPLPGCDLRLLDSEGRALPSDDESLGELWVKSPGVFEGYLNAPRGAELRPPSAPLDVEGYFRTGDLGCRRADGSLRVLGRASLDLIKSGGFRIGAGEIEAVLLEGEGVSEVAVVGVPDDDLGERVEAFVVAEAGASLNREAILALGEAGCGRHKAPRKIHWIEALPRNAMGKVDKRVLKLLAGPRPPQE